MTAPVPLRRVQEAFWDLIAAPEGVRPGLTSLEAEGALAPSDVEAWFLGDERADALSRLDIYASMYFYRLKDALAEDFPNLVAHLGHDRWHDLVTDFLLAHPSTRPSLRWVGEPLPGYLASHPLSGPHPYVPDLAALEWARSDVFQQLDAPPVDRAALGAVPPEAWADLTLLPIPALHVVRSRWNVAALWRRLEDGETVEPGSVEARDQAILVWRQELTARHRSLDEDEARALDALVTRRTFAEVCEAIAGDDGDVEAAAASAAGFLGNWLEEELVAGFAAPGI